MGRSVCTKVARFSRRCKGHERVQAHVNGLFYVVGVCILIRQCIVGIVLQPSHPKTVGTFVNMQLYDRRIL